MTVPALSVSPEPPLTIAADVLVLGVSKTDDGPRLLSDAAMRLRRSHKRPALDEAALRELALAYVSRFATSGARLVRYLDRKIRERGWAGEAEADPEALATRFAELGYLDDASYARMKGASMQRRGLGAARIRGALAADGVAEGDREPALDEAREGRWEAADVLARRSRMLFLDAAQAEAQADAVAAIVCDELGGAPPLLGLDAFKALARRYRHIP